MSYKYSLNGKTAWVTNFGSNAFRGTSPLRTEMNFQESNILKNWRAQMHRR